MLCKIISFKNPADLEKLLFIEIASEFSLASIYTAFYQKKNEVSVILSHCEPMNYCNALIAFSFTALFLFLHWFLQFTIH